jgi:hypothetical protein
VAAFVLWLELLIRAAAVYVAVLFLPLALATLVWPAVSHWCRRLVETLAALILSKFVIVATLSLAAGAVSSGTSGTGDHGSGFSSVLAGGALLLMATFVPFAILRMIPAVEAGAVSHLDGLRQRGTAAMTRVPKTAASHALHEGLGALGDSRLLAMTPAAGGGSAGGGAAGLAAGAAGLGGDGPSSGGDGASSSPAIPMGEGDPEMTESELRAYLNRPVEKGPNPVLPAPTFSAGSLDAATNSGAGSPSGADANSESGATGFEPDPADRVGARRSTGLQGRIGPATAEDAWMWQGVPPGRALIGRYQPGERRFYMGDNAGPSLQPLDPAWPPGEGPDA